MSDLDQVAALTKRVNDLRRKCREVAEQSGKPAIAPFVFKVADDVEARMTIGLSETHHFECVCFSSPAQAPTSKSALDDALRRLISQKARFDQVYRVDGQPYVLAPMLISFPDWSPDTLVGAVVALGMLVPAFVEVVLLDRSYTQDIGVNSLELVSMPTFAHVKPGGVQTADEFSEVMGLCDSFIADGPNAVEKLEGAIVSLRSLVEGDLHAEVIDHNSPVQFVPEEHGQVDRPNEFAIEGFGPLALNGTYSWRDVSTSIQNGEVLDGIFELKLVDGTVVAAATVTAVYSDPLYLDPYDLVRRNATDGGWLSTFSNNHGELDDVAVDAWATEFIPDSLARISSVFIAPAFRTRELLKHLVCEIRWVVEAVGEAGHDIGITIEAIEAPELGQPLKPMSEQTRMWFEDAFRESLSAIKANSVNHGRQSGVEQYCSRHLPVFLIPS